MEENYPTRPRFPLGEGVAEIGVQYRGDIICPHCKQTIDMHIAGLDWKIRGPSDVATRLMARARNYEQEVLYVLSLNAQNRVIAEPHVAYVGNVTSALARIAELVREPIRLNAAGMILAHTHPSGETTPSADDLHLTATVLAAARLLNIDLLDHIVLGKDQWTSLRDRGITFDR